MLFWGGSSFMDGLSMLTIHDHSGAILEWGKLSQRLVNCAIGQWRRWLECIVQQQSGHTEHLT